ncbi:MAG: DUF3426 domain-containing protein, partial [Burkholderiales bacterium]|nr:DUF3426 domain-containing protein [Burkholderiales bacterium]
ATPALDLSLSDTRGAPIARRVVPLAEFGFARPSVPGQAELALQATLDLGERAVSGYTIELFYP